jgi:EAL domain-containing protein (putative c-di-GMP-specific phosphodiesterase class I)
MPQQLRTPNRGCYSEPDHRRTVPCLWPVSPSKRSPSALSVELDRILDSGLLRTSFQPIFDFESTSIVAYGTVIQGPLDSPLHSAEALRSAAIDSDRLLAYDDASRRTAMQASEQAGLSLPRSLFFHAEPDTIHALSLDDTALSRPMVLEIRGKSLRGADLIALLQSIVSIRDRGWGIALTEVCVDEHALALLPVIAPDVIDIDLQLIDGLPDQHVAPMVSAISAYAEATGCLVLASGVETARQVVTARALGATLGRGPLYAVAGPLPSELPWMSGVRPAPTGRLAGLRRDTPFSVTAERREARPSHRDLLLQVSQFLEARAAQEAGSAVVLTTFQHRDNFDARAMERYYPLGGSTAFVAVFGPGFSELTLSETVRAVELDEADPMVAEWNVVVISPNFAATLTARQVGEPSPSNDAWEFILTHDRRLTIEAARTLVARI